MLIVACGYRDAVHACAVYAHDVQVQVRRVERRRRVDNTAVVGRVSRIPVGPCIVRQAGLLLTAAGSVFYHLQPDALRLAADRAGMAVAFAGLIGFAVCERVSQRAGWPAAWFVLAAGLLAVAVFHATGNVLPWAVLQFGGMLLVFVLALARPVPGAIGFKLGWVIFFYALAKLFELSDHALYEATHHVVSGHSVKHLTAALAALPVLQALGLMTRKGLRHNSATAALTA